MINRKQAILALFLICFTQAGAQDISGKLLTMKLKSIDGVDFSFNELKKNKASVIIFLSPDCPLCQNYALTMKQLQEEYGTSGIHIYGVFPGTWYTINDIKQFKADYHLSMVMLTDRDKSLTHLLNARVTPEAVVLNAEGTIIYEGRIDNWMYAAGKKRTIITKHELKDALDAVVNNKPVAVSKTEAVGCLIE